MADKEWSENSEDDPIELQKEQLKLGREFMERIKKQEAEEKARQEEYVAAGPAARRFAAPVYTPPTFEEVSAHLKKIWDEIERIMPTAPTEVKALAFTSLFHATVSSAGGFGVARAE